MFATTIQRVAYWRDWPPERQRGALYLLTTLIALIFFFLWFWLHAWTVRTEEQSRLALERHARVLEMVQEIRGTERKHDRPQATMPVLIAARQVSRDIGLEDKLTSVRPALQATGRDGVQLYYEQLNLPDLLALLEALSRDAGLRTSTLTFNRRMDNPSLADLQLVLFR
ncbi:Type II secretion system (T2SS), protein M [Desulfonatronum thiosulfatophilum]|uniref:Type II secretion system (T2SS), protein M n=1 Tax=Desulfonatronum thiosulfatophilum TaxID=617002 RepID=A0A1G6EF74_9BACT|nr:type II secretion system protein GspM [Desulfonatronum thiosulfatophilum]SDB55595.1 Type II secretion system (T2SS), protein M [Desulfonatronum thiosulfatophilum]